VVSKPGSSINEGLRSSAGMIPMYRTIATLAYRRTKASRWASVSHSRSELPSHSPRRNNNRLRSLIRSGLLIEYGKRVIICLKYVSGILMKKAVLDARIGFQTPFLALVVSSRLSYTKVSQSLAVSCIKLC
jgi:hypothetical protein